MILIFSSVFVLNYCQKGSANYVTPEAPKSTLLYNRQVQKDKESFANTISNVTNTGVLISP